MDVQEKMQELAEELRPLVARIALVAAEELSLDRDLLATGFLDSIQVIELATELESKYAISLDAMDLTPENFSKLENLADLISRRLAAQEG